MLCQKCNQNEATISLQLNINGQEQQLHLCQHCAQALQQQYFGQMGSMLWPFGNLAGMLFGQTAPATAGRPAQRPEISGEVDQDLARRREISALRTQLDAAVKSENYERAIELRDEISRLNDAH